MGFGYRVYKSYDLCVKILKGLKDELYKKGVKMDERLSEIVVKVEEIVLKDEYFIERNFYFNVDFYFGMILRVLKILVCFFMLVFVIG